MAVNAFVGSWSLKSFEYKSLDGRVSYPFGVHPHGYITYSQDGFMSVAFMTSGRPNFKSEDLRRSDPDEKIAAFDTYFSYCGRYEILGEKVIHHVEICLYPNWTGKDQERFFRFDGNQLILTTPPILRDGIQQTATLVWEKAC